MKRKNILIVAVSAIMVSAGYISYTNSYHHDKLSDIQRANIEALTFGEFIVGSGWECFKTVYDDVTNPMFITVIECNTCNTTSAVYVNGSDYCTFTGIYGR